MSDFQDKMNEVLDTNDATETFDPADVEKNKVMAILAYFSWLVLIPIFAAKDSPFAKFHVNQGLVIAITEIIVCGILGALGGIPLIGFIFKIASKLAGLICAVASIFGIIGAAQGHAKELPFFGAFKLIK